MKTPQIVEKVEKQQTIIFSSIYILVYCVILQQCYFSAMIAVWLWGWQCLLVSPAVQARLKYLKKQMHCHEYVYRHPLW